MSIRIENIQVDNLNLGDDKILEKTTVDSVTTQIGDLITNYYYNTSGKTSTNGIIENAVIEGLRKLNGYTKSTSYVITNKNSVNKLYGGVLNGQGVHRTRCIAIGTSSFGLLSHQPSTSPNTDIQTTSDLLNMSYYGNESILRKGNVASTKWGDGSTWNDLSNPGRSIFVGAGLRTISTDGWFINLVCYDGTQWREIWSMPTASLSGSNVLYIPNSTQTNITYQNGVITVPVKDYTRYWTDNYGESWQLCTNAGGGPPTDFQIHRTATGILYIYQVNGGRYSDTDGKTWKSLGIFPNTPVTTKTNHLLDTNPNTGISVYAPDGPNMMYYASSGSYASWPQAGGAMPGAVFSTGSAKHVFWCGDLFIALNNQNCNTITASLATSPSGSDFWTLRHLTGTTAASPLTYAMKYDNRYWVFNTQEVRFATGSNLASWSLAYTITSGDTTTNATEKHMGTVIRNNNGFIHTTGLATYYYDKATSTMRSASNTEFTSDYEWTNSAIPSGFSYMKVR